VKLVYLPSARKHFREAMEYLHREAGPRVTAKIRAGILDEAERLKQFPGGGQEEEYLSHLGKGHRRLVQGNYKIIYRIEGEVIYITDIFDTRQDPARMSG
jgi:plasmid stabilization system protein ParE